MTAIGYYLFALLSLGIGAAAWIPIRKQGDGLGWFAAVVGLGNALFGIFLCKAISEWRKR